MTGPGWQSFLVNNFIWVYSQGTAQILLCTSCLWYSWAWESPSDPWVRALEHTLQDAGLCTPFTIHSLSLQWPHAPSFQKQGNLWLNFSYQLTHYSICQVSFLETLGHKGLSSSWPWQGFSETVEQTTKFVGKLPLELLKRGIISISLIWSEGRQGVKWILNVQENRIKETTLLGVNSSNNHFKSEQPISLPG